MLSIKESSNLAMRSLSDPKYLLGKLKKIRSQHALWNNPLLKACHDKALTFVDFQYIFSQYYLYSKNFSRLLAAMMVNCENDLYRSKLAENLWEESGEKELEKRHAEIFRQFLQEHLKISDLNEINFDRSTEVFVQNYLDLCLNSPALESAAALSLGTEGIVSDLYVILKQGLLGADLLDETLTFFNIHIACDDAHAETLEEILLSFTYENNWFDRARSAMIRVLDLRHEFFNSLYNGILNRRLSLLAGNISSRPAQLQTFVTTELKSRSASNENVMYHNNDEASGINFTVKRVPFKSDVLDPRLVSIPPGYANEYHSHAHETVFLILDGEGEVTIEHEKIVISSGDLVFVPRWLQHQTRNTGSTELRFFAVTDYGLTRRIPVNNETVYRLKQENFKDSAKKLVID